MAPRLSVIVPFFGVEAYIAECLRSIGRQTFDDFEVVLIDDGSLDGSAAIAHDFATRDRRFRVIAQENRGLGLARNAGVEQSVGEFLTFVDSDDVVPRHAFETMVRILDQTGSSFAAGDVRRFNGFGVRESLLHRGPFARLRLATHVFEYPPLAVDRIMCNKVYRRRFWDEFGYEFPAIRYEDYPIALRSHLDAVTVDCVPTAVYFWRFRDSGGSITDQSDEYANLLDRVTSAEMVIELVSSRAPELRERVHRHLVRVDLLPVLRAFRTASAADEDRFVELGQRLLGRLDEAVLTSARPFDRLQIGALREGDATALRELAAYRNDHDVETTGRAHRRRFAPWRWEWHPPSMAVGSSSASRSVQPLRQQELALHTAVTAVQSSGSTVAVRGTAEIRHVATDKRSRLRVTLTGSGVEIPCVVARFTTLDSSGENGLVGFEVRIEGTTLASLPQAVTVVHLSAELTSGGVRRKGFLGGSQPGSPQYARGAWVREGLWAQPRTDSLGRLAFDLLEEPACLTSAAVIDGVFVLSGRLPKDVAASHLVLSEPDSDDGLMVNLELRPQELEVQFTCRVPLSDVIADFDSEDPLAEPMTRALRIPGVDAWRSSLVPTGLDRAVGVLHESLLVLLTRTSDNSAAFSVSSNLLVADEVATNPTASRSLIVAGGPLCGDSSVRGVVWRLIAEPFDRAVDVPCEFSRSGDRWSAPADVGDLVAELGFAHDDGGSAIPMIFALFSIADDGSARPVHVDGFLSSDLPSEIRQRGRIATVLPEGTQLRMVIR